MVGAPGRFVGLAELRRAVPRRRLPPDGLEQHRLHGRRRRHQVRASASTMALILDQERRFNNLFRTLLFVPWAMPDRHRVPELALDLRRPLRLPQQLPDHLPHHPRHHLLALRPEPRHGLRHRRRGLGGHALLHDDVPGRAPGDPQGALRGRRDRRRLDRPAVLLRHHPAAPHDLPDDGDALHDLDGHEPPVRLHPHQGRPGGSDGDLPAPRLHDGARGASASAWAPPCRSCSSRVLVLLIIFLTRRMLRPTDE